jgi:hypothetical protein
MPVSLYDLGRASNGRRACGADDDWSLSRNAPSPPRLTSLDLLTPFRACAEREKKDGGSQDYARANTGFPKQKTHFYVNEHGTEALVLGVRGFLDRFKEVILRYPAHEVEFAW